MPRKTKPIPPLSDDERRQQIQEINEVFIMEEKQLGQVLISTDLLMHAPSMEILSRFIQLERRITENAIEVLYECRSDYFTKGYKLYECTLIQDPHNPDHYTFKAE